MPSLEKLIGVVLMRFRLSCIISLKFNSCFGLKILSQQQRGGNSVYNGTALQRFCIKLLNQEQMKAKACAQLPPPSTCTIDTQFATYVYLAIMDGRCLAKDMIASLTLAFSSSINGLRKQMRREKPRACRDA